MIAVEETLLYRIVWIQPHWRLFQHQLPVWDLTKESPSDPSQDFDQGTLKPSHWFFRDGPSCAADQCPAAESNCTWALGHKLTSRRSPAGWSGRKCNSWFHHLWPVFQVLRQMLKQLQTIWLPPPHLTRCSRSHVFQNAVVLTQQSTQYHPQSHGGHLFSLVVVQAFNLSHWCRFLSHFGSMNTDFDPLTLNAFYISFIFM